MKTQSEYFSKALLLVTLMSLSHAGYGVSLWRSVHNDERGIIADKVAANVGDILTITIDESYTQKNELKTESDKTANILGAVTSYLFPSSGLGTHNGEFPSTDIELNSDKYTGGGKIENTSELKATTSVTVVDKLPNGNLVIKGVRDVSFSEQKEYAVLTGIVRPYDIKGDNTVLSSRIANAKVHFLKEGSLASAQKKGWLLKFKDFINPF